MVPVAGRLDRVQAWLDAERVPAAYLTDPVSIGYLTGFLTHPGERLMALVLRSSGGVLVVPALERESAEARVAGLPVMAWQDGSDPFTKVAEALGQVPLLAVEKSHLSLAAAERLRDRVGAIRLVDAGPELRRQRAVKSAGELDALGRAAALTDRVWEEAGGRLRGGQGELEAAALVDGLVAGAGGKLSFETIVQSGPNGALPHLRPTSRRLQAGDLVLVDFGASLDGYKGDLTRMAVVGEPTSRQLELHQLVLAAHDAALAAVRPGVTAGAVDAAARQVIQAAGLGDRFIHRIGHGLGLEAHEHPSLDPGSDTVLEAGMVVTIEPGVYLPGWGGIRIEDDVVVEAGGARLLTQAPHPLRVVAAS
ncbi:MAG TPA: Xaa-Pro peptidase family protein [Candidatus Acidoferrales bacterium]|nr:Xaa-Pro peptidase family protein [Candidatus Acidoferrales bacterium]